VLARHTGHASTVGEPDPPHRRFVQPLCPTPLLSPLNTDVSHSESCVHMVRRCGILAGMPVSTGLFARPVALVERRHVDLMRVSGCQCCCPLRMR
jgi:hypothetical protein